MYSAIKTGHGDVYTTMNAHITSAPTSSTPEFLGRNARFAVALTVSVAAVAWFLASVAKLSEETIVISIMVVAFVASWISTSPRTTSNHKHRVTVVGVRSRVR